MKYCPYCGWELQDSNVSFCSECEKKLNGDNDERSQTPKSKNKSKFHSKKTVMSSEKSTAVIK
jgi:predicted amidophosphoribosyltransferase